MLPLTPPQQQQANILQWTTPNPFLRPTLPSFYRGPGLPGSYTGEITPPEKTDADLIFDSIRQIVETRQGERLLLPSFGSRIYELIGEPLTQVFEFKVQQFLTNAVKTWETRVRLLSVRFLYNENSVTITYGIQLIKLGEVAQSSFQIPRNL